MAWLSRATSASSNLPTSDPSFDFGTVVILSTIRRDAARNPFFWLGSIANLNKGASTESVVKAQIVTDAVLSKLSSWTITAGRGLPA